MVPSNLRETARCAIGLLIAAILAHTWVALGVFMPVVVSGRSMEPTLSAGDRLVVDRTAFAVRPPRRWEVVVLRCPDRAQEFCVKRVIGLPGETVSVKDGLLLVNGKAIMRLENAPRALGALGIDGLPILVWPWPGASEFSRDASWRLGAESYFVIGDNPSESDDSRFWQGEVTAKLLVGRPVGVR